MLIMKERLSNEMKVSKFGGSSVATAEQIIKVLNIVNSDNEGKS